MTQWILLVLTLYIVQTLLPPTMQWMVGPSGNQLWAALGGRDNPPPMPNLGGRFHRALHNMEEALFVFLPVAIMLNLKQSIPEMAVTAAKTFFFARLFYVGAYATGIPGLRSAIWCIGFAANLVMAYLLLP